MPTTPRPRLRRSHTKSRGGCAECKRRKKKCDEERPVCSRCIKGLVRCDYSISGSPYPLTARSDSPHSGPSTEIGPLSRRRDSSASPDGSCPPTGTRTLGVFDMDDMVLWHHFITDTAATMAGPWEPRIAGSCPYLMHGILSTAALHLAYLHPSQRDRYEEVSAEHRNLALGPFRQALSHITAENCHQVFAFSVLMIIAQFAPSRSLQALGLPGTALYKGPANWIVCMRACDSILSQAVAQMQAGPFGVLLEEAMGALNLIEKTEVAETKDDQSLEALSEHILAVHSSENEERSENSTTATEDVIKAYTHSISLLRKMIAASSSASDSLSCRIFASLWATQVHEAFVQALHEERPAALSILAHYCLLLNRCHSCWYIEHRAFDLLMAVKQGLPEEWLAYVEHPLTVVQQR